MYGVEKRKVERYRKIKK